MPYPEIMIHGMRQELARLGIEETKSPEQVKDAVVEEAAQPLLPLLECARPILEGAFVGAPHACGVEIRVVAEGDAESHQREGYGEAEKDRKNQDEKHEDGDDGVGHFFSSCPLSSP